MQGESFDEFYDYPFSIEALNFEPKIKKIKNELLKCKNLEKRDLKQKVTKNILILLLVLH